MNLPTNHRVLAVDDLKRLIQLGKALGAFARFAEFQGIAEAAVTLGRLSAAASWPVSGPAGPPLIPMLLNQGFFRSP